MLPALLKRVNLRLVDDAHHAWKWSSMRFLALGGVVQGAVVTCPAAVSEHLPDWVMSSASTFSFCCIIAAGLGRITTTEKSDVRNSDSPNPGS